MAAEESKMLKAQVAIIRESIINIKKALGEPKEPERTEEDFQLLRRMLLAAREESKQAKESCYNCQDKLRDCENHREGYRVDCLEAERKVVEVQNLCNDLQARTNQLSDKNSYHSHMYQQTLIKNDELKEKIEVLTNERNNYFEELQSAEERLMVFANLKQQITKIMTQD